VVCNQKKHLFPLSNPGITHFSGFLIQFSDLSGEEIYDYLVDSLSYVLNNSFLSIFQGDFRVDFLDRKSVV
jgi:hypothetical protein